MSQRTANIIVWIAALCIPFMFAAVVTTLVIAPWLPSFEYNRPSVPLDAYGWNQEERLELALVAVEYLRERGSAEDTIYLLEDQRMPDRDEPLYNEREIKHMVDVKVRTDLIRRGAYVLGIIVVACLTILLYSDRTESAAYRAVRNGGYVTIGILVGVGAFLLLAWETFFVQFHELLFPPGSWTFYNTDSLIRLFPEKLWFDVGTFIVGGTLGAGILCVLIGQMLLNRTKK